MSYTPATVTASSKTFADLRAGGLNTIIDTLLANNTSWASATVVEMVNGIRDAMYQDKQWAIRPARDVLWNYLSANPVDVAAAKVSLKASADAFRVLVTALDEVITLVDAQPDVTISVAGPNGVSTIRSF